MAFKQISVKQAHDALEEDPNAIYIDVRTVREFTAGHPEGAINIPVAFPNPGGMMLNEDFVHGLVEGVEVVGLARELGDAEEGVLQDAGALGLGDVAEVPGPPADLAR